jgi:hypothetical protein
MRREAIAIMDTLQILSLHVFIYSSSRDGICLDLGFKGWVWMQMEPLNSLA